MDQIIPFAFEKRLGVIPYQRTGQELQVAGLAPASTTPYYDSTFFSTPILMQGKSPECGGFSLAFYIQYLLKTSQLSGSFSYAYEKTQDGVPDVEGTTIKAIGDCATSGGSCLINLFPDDGNTTTDPNGNSTLFTSATSQAITDAATRDGWIPLFLTDLSWSGLQSAISKYGAVLVEAQVGNEWYTAANGIVSWNVTDVLPIRPPATVIDSHFFILGGQYDSTSIYFANSWSTAWGQNGFGYLQQNYLPYIQNAMVLYKSTPAIQAVQSSQTLSQQEKNGLIQAIIQDIEQAISLIQKEL